MNLEMAMKVAGSSGRSRNRRSRAICENRYQMQATLVSDIASATWMPASRLAAISTMESGEAR
ncbi:hypothetical protein D9M68_112840 [compost metagenome]